MLGEMGIFFPPGFFHEPSDEEGAALNAAREHNPMLAGREHNNITRVGGKHLRTLRSTTPTSTKMSLQNINSFIYLTLPVKLTERHNSLRQLLWPLQICDIVSL